MKHPRWVTPVIIAGALVLIGLVVAAFAVFDHALHRSSTDVENAWFTGEGLIVAIVALFLAGLAVLFTLPAYGDWRQRLKRQPEIAITIEACMAAAMSELKMIPHGDTFADRARAANDFNVFIRVAVHNGGTGPLEGGELNVMTPWGYDPVPFEPQNAVLPLRRIPGPLKDGDLHPGQVSDVALLAVAADFPPSSVRMFHLLCRSCPPNQKIDLLARASGNELDNPVKAAIKIMVQP